MPKHIDTGAAIRSDLAYIGEAWLPHAIVFDFLDEHGKRAHPQSAFTVQGTIHHHPLHGFAVTRHAEYLIVAALIMAVAPRLRFARLFHRSSSDVVGVLSRCLACPSTVAGMRLFSGFLSFM